jgi:anti-sigma factor RsiW
MKVPYVEDKPTPGGFGTPSEDDLRRMIRTTVDEWRPRRGPDWSDLMVRIAGTGPPAWLLYTSASAALVVILLAAFIIGSALQLGALAPQSIPSNIHH